MEWTTDDYGEYSLRNFPGSLTLPAAYENGTGTNTVRPSLAHTEYAPEMSLANFDLVYVDPVANPGANPNIVGMAVVFEDPRVNDANPAVAKLGQKFCGSINRMTYR